MLNPDYKRLRWKLSNRVRKGKVSLNNRESVDGRPMSYDLLAPSQERTINGEAVRGTLEFDIKLVLPKV